MNVLAVECSTSLSSLALLVDDQPVAESAWDLSTGRHEHALSVLPAMLDEAQLAYEALDLYAVGRGPGNYSGMRVAVSVVRALALPDHKPVFALSSGEVLARDLAGEYPGRTVAVVGDARRGAWWAGLFNPSEGDLVQLGTWSLTRPEELARMLPEGAVVVSPEWNRLAPNLARYQLEGLDWVRENRFPTARGVARLARARTLAGRASDPVAPLYLHQAV